MLLQETQFSDSPPRTERAIKKIKIPALSRHNQRDKVGATVIPQITARAFAEPLELELRRSLPERLG